MRLWVESAHQAITASAAAPSRDLVRTFTSEDMFLGCVASHISQSPASSAESVPEIIFASLVRGTTLEAATGDLLAALGPGAYVPVAILQVLAGSRARLVECDAPPLFMARRGHLEWLPFVEEEVHGHLIRRCDFELRDGDHLALVSEGYLQSRKWDRSFGWRDVAISLRRLTETRCGAEQLAGALARLANQRIDKSMNRQEGDKLAARQLPFVVLALFVRPMRTATVWSGPPSRPGLDPQVARRFMAEEDIRIICGDTTAEIAARLLGANLVAEPPPEEGWREVPPTSRLVASDSPAAQREQPDGRDLAALVTEGVVTLRSARERLATIQQPRELMGRKDGASRLIRLLLTADKITFLIGMAVNQAQTEPNGTPLRKAAVGDLVKELKARGKILSIAYY